MPPRAIILSLDQLSRRCLGCYGHEWIETPNWDRLASRAVVFDQCVASPSPQSALPDAMRIFCDRLSSDGIVAKRLSELAVSDTDELSQTAFAQLMTAAEKVLGKLSRDKTASWLLCLESSSPRYTLCT